LTNKANQQCKILTKAYAPAPVAAADRGGRLLNQH
jgi:hypothetical protein